MPALRRARRKLLTIVLGAMVGTSATEARADDVAGFVGATASGLPGLGRVAVASPRPAYVSASAGAGYGYTERQQGEAGSHQRGFGTLGLAVQPLRFLAGALSLDGRWDTHPSDVLGPSASAIGEPRLFVRAAHAVAPSFALGAQLGLLLAGAEAPSIRFDSSTLDGLLLATFSPPGSDLAIAFNGGYRLDNTAQAIDAPQRLRRGDRIALRASAFDQVLLGLGASKRVGRLELLGELTWDLLLGSKAPSAIESPLRLGLGARVQVSDPAVMPEGIQIEVRTEIGLSERPGSQTFDPIAPIEPRFGLIVGLRFGRVVGKRPRPPGTTDKPTNPVTQPPTPVDPSLGPVGTITGRIVTDAKEPLANATVALGDRTVTTGPDGAFALDNVPAGKTTLTVKAPGYDDASIDVDVVANTAAHPADTPLKKTIKPGSLRGLVRSFAGKPLAATIRVEPLGIETTTDADGAFKIDVPPGSYEVVIAAPGYAGQRRRLQVGENGVTVLNADLRQGQ